MLHNYGRVKDHPRTDNLIDYRLDFLYEGIRRSIFTITMEADSLRTIINKYLLGYYSISYSIILLLQVSWTFS